MRAIILILMAASVSLASAFGGGGGGGGDGGGGSGGSSETPPAVVYADQYVQVSSEEGAPLSGVLVVLTEKGSTQAIASAKTDSDGKAYFKLQKGKEADAGVRVSGFEPSRQSITAESGTVRIILKREKQESREKSQETAGEKMRPTAYSVRGRALPCGDETTMRERIRCRLSVRTGDYNSLYYVPEECRAAANNSSVQSCLGLYDDVQSCRKLDGQEERFACVREKLGMNGTVNQSIAACRASSNPVACIATLRASALSLAKFKLYNLEERAEYLISEGMPRETVEAFIEKMEQLKLDFNAAATIKEKQQILRNALAEWRKFKHEAAAQLKEKENSG